ncbi:hypothetical protein HDU98_010547 [Podochytrium sp. JEL0797]|nr:hypothetical protein HDU98_010547 [Podochytrium sp. JEL0797]
MLITESLVDVPTSQGPMRLHVFAPTVTVTTHKHAKLCGIAVFTEIYQVTGPVERFCRQIAGNGFIVACPESYHEFEPLGTVLKYDVEGTDRGNFLKVEKTLKAYDEDATAVLDYLMGHPNCNGRLGATGMCLGGHLAFRCAFDPRVLATVCYFATDIHSETLGKGKSDSLIRLKEIKGETVMIFGKFDNHVPRQGRQLIYQKLADANVDFGWVELPAQHAFIRDELSKGRYDPPLTKICFEVLLEVFQRRLVLGFRQILTRRSYATAPAAVPAGAKTGPSASKVAMAVGLPLAFVGSLYWCESSMAKKAKQTLLQKKAQETPTAALTDPKEFQNFTLVATEKLTPNTSRFVFALPEGATELGLPTASCVVTKFTNGVKPDGKPDVVIRPYTPVEDPSLGYTGTFDLIVKKYPNGPMSTHIFDLKRGDTLAMKGPIPKYQYAPNKDGHIGMIAGGTGITPMLQVIHRALSDSHDDTKLTLLFANVTEQDIILRDQLDALAKQHKNRFSVHYTLDRPSEKWSGLSGFVNSDMLTSLMPAPGQGKVFVCGPGPMVAHISGPKAKDFTQGELGGLLETLGYEKSDVFKF